MSVVDLDPQIIEVLRKAEEAGAPPVEELTPEELRANFVKVAKEQFGPVDEVFSVEDRDADGVPVRIYRPVETSEPSRALVYFHGGGCVIGSIETHDGITRALAKRARVRRHLGRLPARARAPVPGGARRLLDRRRAG